MGCTGLFPVVLTLSAQDLDIDTSCFGLDANGQLSDERFMVFYNQLSSPNGSISLDISTNTSTFHTDLSRLPETVYKLVFTASINGEGTMRKLGISTMCLGDTTFTFSGTDFQDEKAVIVGEIYKRDGQWRFGAVGQGFNGGLSALLQHFGGTEALPTLPAAGTTPGPDSIKPSPKVSLSKITLEKRGDKISLEKSRDHGFGRIRVNLNWNQSAAIVSPPAKLGFLSRALGDKSIHKNQGIDLDLGCMFEMVDSTSGCVQALGKSWGHFSLPPYIELENDDRSGANTAGENIFINGDQFHQLKRVLVYTFIYDGVPNWAATDGVVSIEVPGRAPVEVRLDSASTATMCAIAMLENIGGKLQITKLVEYFQSTIHKSGHALMNDRFRFGLRFKAGSKD